MSSNTTEKFIAEGTTCHSCEEIIKKQALKVKGVKEVHFDYATEKGKVTFDENETDIDTILYKIEEKGYKCYILDNKAEINGKADKKSFGWVFLLIGLLIAGYFLFTTFEGISVPQISQNMGYGLLFIVGLLTGFHCVAMCGGFVVSYSARAAQKGLPHYKSHMMYAVGKTLSYTIIGAAFGLLGSIIAFTPALRGGAGMLAGLFLIIFGLNMLNIFPSLRKIQIKMPLGLFKFIGKEERKHNHPLAIGLLNGLMIACGPLQAIYIMAAGTGSMLEGAKLLFVFGLGTLPVMIGFGYLTSIISSKATHKILKASGVIVIILGVVMLNRGLALAGTGLDANTLIASVSATSKDISGSAVTLEGEYQVIRMDVTRYGWEPNKFVLKKGMPVKWVINGKEINGCNNAIQVPKYGLRFDIRPGEQTIEFTPTEEGVVPWSCWMGMITGTFIVKEDVGSAQDVQNALAAIPQSQGGSCGGGSGGCGCGR